MLSGFNGTSLRLTLLWAGVLRVCWWLLLDDILASDAQVVSLHGLISAMFHWDKELLKVAGFRLFCSMLSRLIYAMPWRVQ